MHIFQLQVTKTLFIGFEHIRCVRLQKVLRKQHNVNINIELCENI